MGGGCEAWCCEHHPCRTPACSNASTTQVELPPLPIQRQLSSAPSLLDDTPATAAAPQIPQPCEAPPAASSQPHSQPQEELMIPPPPLPSEPPSSPCPPPTAPAPVQPQDDDAQPAVTPFPPPTVQPEDTQMDGDDGGAPSGTPCPPPIAPSAMPSQDIQIDVNDDGGAPTGILWPLPSAPTPVQPQDIQMDDAGPPSDTPCPPPPHASTPVQPQIIHIDIDDDGLPPSSPRPAPSGPIPVQPEDTQMDDAAPPADTPCLPPPSIPTPIQPQDVHFDVEEPRPPTEQQLDDIVVPPAVPAPHVGSDSISGGPPRHEENRTYPPPGHRPYPDPPPRHEENRTYPPPGRILEADPLPRRDRHGEYIGYVDPPPRRGGREECYDYARRYEQEFGVRDQRSSRYTDYYRDHRSEMGRRPLRCPEDDSWEWLPRGHRQGSGDFSNVTRPPPRGLDDRDGASDMPRRSRRDSERYSTNPHVDADEHNDEGPGVLVRDNVIIGDATGVRIGEGNRGGRRTGGRVTGNVVSR